LKTATYTSFAILTFLLLLGACGGRSLVVPPFDSSGIESRAAVQTEGLITVRAAVLSPTEAEEMYGVDLYAGGVQPVWIEVQNAGDEALRFAPVGTDREYFSPLEVAYVNRGGLSEESRDAMNRRFYRSAMRRDVSLRRRDLRPTTTASTSIHFMNRQTPVMCEKTLCLHWSTRYCVA